MNIYISKIFVLCMILGVFGIGTAIAAPSVTIDPASTTGLSLGDTFSINIHVDPDGNGVSGGQIDLSFDTSVLEVTDLTAGNILGAPIIDPGSKYDNTAGTVEAIYARIGATTPPTEAGTWATVTFQVKTGAADSTTTIAITSAGLADESFADMPGIITTDGTATVGAAVPTITSTEAVIALQIAAGGSDSCDDTMLAAADVSGDGKVTSLDALMIMQAAAGVISL